MKKIYYTPFQLNKYTIIGLGALTILALVCLELEREIWDKSKMELAVKKTVSMYNCIKQEKESLGILSSIEEDPLQIGMLGTWNSLITTRQGDKLAKQISANPNFAALATRLLCESGVKKGDVVAVGLTGSYPAFNVCVLAAIESIEAKPIIISSVGSSQYGANTPGMLWPDIENLLYQKNYISEKSTYSSLGGIDDLAIDNSPKGVNEMLKSIKKNGAKLLKENIFEINLNKRFEIYKNAGKDNIAAYVNIGGGLISAGNSKFGEYFTPGLNKDLSKETLLDYPESMMKTFALKGIPVLHFRHALQLARKYNLPLEPLNSGIENRGGVFKTKYNRYLAAFFLSLISIILFFEVKNKKNKRTPVL